MSRRAILMPCDPSSLRPPDTLSDDLDFINTIDTSAKAASAHIAAELSDSETDWLAKSILEQTADIADCSRLLVLQGQAYSAMCIMRASLETLLRTLWVITKANNNIGSLVKYYNDEISGFAERVAAMKDVDQEAAANSRSEIDQISDEYRACPTMPQTMDRVLAEIYSASSLVPKSFNNSRDAHTREIKLMHQFAHGNPLFLRSKSLLRRSLATMRDHRTRWCQCLALLHDRDAHVLYPWILIQCFGRSIRTDNKSEMYNRNLVWKEFCRAPLLVCDRLTNL